MMKRAYAGIFLCLAMAASGGNADLRLAYTTAAPDTGNAAWEHWSLPIGNGFFGASVFGGVTNEHLVLSHGAVYARTAHRSNPELGLPTFTRAMDVYIRFPHRTAATDYRRSLDIGEAVADVSYDADGVRYTREYFTSYPDRVMGLRFTANRKGGLAFTLRPEIPFLQDFGMTNAANAHLGRRGTVVADRTGLGVRVEMEGYNIRYALRFEVVTDGRTVPAGDALSVSGATEATVFVSFETNFTLDSERMNRNLRQTKGCDPNAPDPMIAARRLASAAARKGWASVRGAHVADYRALFDRVALDLGEDGEDARMPTDQLLLAYRNGRPSAYLETLYAQYGRYLLIASSRPGGLPANLQGVWTNYRNSPWSGGYWHNINIQMNYWPSFAGNLLECFEPYAAWHAAMRPVVRYPTIEGLLRAARNHPAVRDGLPKDPFRDLAPDAWSVSVGEYPYHVDGGTGAASGLTSKLFMEWWDFSREDRVLREHAWPVMHGAADVLTHYVVWTNNAWLCVDSFSHEQQERDPKTGKLGKYYKTLGCAFDQQMIHENNADCLRLARILGTNDAVTARIERQIGHYEPILIGGSGQIKEFREEDKYGEIGEYHHRHISQLMALMPGTQITRDTPEWMEAAKRTLDFRGDKSTGWALAHRLNAWARTGDGERCHSLLRTLLGQRTHENLWDTHPPFQIDGNFGGTSGILEMLIQSHAGYIDLLPALPKAWAKKGSFRGLRARGGFEVDCAWSDGRPTAVTVRILAGGVPDVRFGGRKLEMSACAGGSSCRWTDAQPAQAFKLSDVTVVYEDALGTRGDPKAEWGTEAVTALTNALSRVVGKPVEAVPESKASAGLKAPVYVGATKAAAAAGLDAAALRCAEFRLKVEPGRAFLLGKTGMASSYAVTEFLKRAADYRFLTIDGDDPYAVTPDRGPACCDITKAPAVYVLNNSFWSNDYRETGPQRGRWFRRIRAYSFCNELEPELMVSLRTDRKRCHTFWAYVPPSRYFKDHPEYYSMDEKGRRFAGSDDGSQLCLTNPDVYRIACESLVSFVEADRAQYGDKAPRIYDFSQNDNSRSLCRCPACKAVIARYNRVPGGHEEGGDAGLLLTFVNRLARDIRAKYPDVQVRTFAYCSTEEPPAGLRPEPNVMIWLCDLYGFSCHDLPLAHPFNRPRLDLFRRWRALTDNIDVWDYTLYTDRTLDVFPDAVAADAKTVRDLGISRYYVENHYWRQPFYELNTYLQAELFFDPNQPLEPLIDAWCRVYGKGAAEMRRGIELLRRLEAENPPATPALWHARIIPWMTPENVERAYAHFTAAYAAESDPVRRWRIAAACATAAQMLAKAYKMMPEKAARYAEVKADYLRFAAEDLAHAPVAGKDLARCRKALEDWEALLDLEFRRLPPELVHAPKADLLCFDARTTTLPFMRGERIPDPESECGRTVWWKSGPKGARTTFGGWVSSGGNPPDAIRIRPGDGTYAWTKVWSGRLGRNPVIGINDFFTWRPSDIYVACDGMDEDPNWYEAWISSKLVGGTAETKDRDHGLFVDRLVLRRIKAPKRGDR